MIWEEHKNKLFRAIGRLVEEDSYLLVTQASERAVMGRLMHYLIYEYPEFDVDCEFNRYFAKSKTLNPESGEDKINPDIIVHKRGEQLRNELVIEIKKIDNIDHQSDMAKLKALTLPYGIGHFGYKWGIHLVFDTRRLNSFKLFKGGSEVDPLQIKL